MRAPLLGLFGAVVAILGLFLAAGTKEATMFFVGMVFFLFGVALNFWLIARATAKPAAADSVPTAHPAE